MIELADRSGASLVGQTLGQYEIRRVLGAGGMGVVYLAEDTRLGRTVALKAIAPQFAADHGRRERLRREARAAATLSHPNIATVYALEQSGDQLFIAAEYVAGETLREEINRGRQPLALVTETAVALARALALAHDRGILHRDLKPENVVRRPDGEVKILDFGLARALVPDTPATPPLTEDGARLGTPLYMSPEQLRGEALDGRSDLFALGLVIYELAAGTHPFAAGDQASTVARILEAEPPDVFASSSVDSQQAAFDAVLRRCLQKAPSRRYQSAAELAAAMEAREAGQASRPSLAERITPLVVALSSGRDLRRLQPDVRRHVLCPRPGPAGLPVQHFCAWRRGGVDVDYASTALVVHAAEVARRVGIAASADGPVDSPRGPRVHRVSGAWGGGGAVRPPLAGHAPPGWRRHRIPGRDGHRASDDARGVRLRRASQDHRA